MTTAPPRPSPSPRWDGLNEGFVSPARLQQWKQEHERVHSLSSPLNTPPQDLTANRPTPERRNTSTDSTNNNGSPTRPTHRSKPSFASFFSRKSVAMDDQPLSSSPLAQPQRSPPSGATMQQRPPPSSFAPQHATLGQSSSPAPSRLVKPHPQQQPLPQQPLPQQSQDPLASPPPQGPPPTQGPVNPDAPPQGPALHPEIRSVVQLTLAHAHKVYFSGPLVRRIERQPDGQKPAKDEGWKEVWAQLGGTTLSVWDMEEIQEASKQGRQVPPAYINVTDAFVAVLGSITLPSKPGEPQKRYTNVLTLNTAGSNLYLFSCPSPEALVQWTAAMRLAAWEKSRLEEIYTAHLIRISLNDGRSAPSPLVNGRLEGWVRIRIAGQTDWKKLWMVISAGNNPGQGDRASVSSIGHDRAESPTTVRKRRMSNIFSREKAPVSNLPARPMIQLFASSKSKDKKKALLTMRSVSQAFAVYPERPELISRSTLMKLEGQLGDEDMAGVLKMREAWLLVMPELEGANTRASEMLRWIIGIHDAFELYGRPKMYSWDPRDSQSMMFAYPIGPHRDLLFLDREFAETLDPRDDRTSAIRSQLQRILLDRMSGVGPGGPPPVPKGPPTLPPLPEVDLLDNGNQQPPQPPPQPQSPPGNGSLSLQLPPLSFDSDVINANTRTEEDQRPLSRISERSTPLEGRSLSAGKSTLGPSGGRTSSFTAASPPRTIAEEPIPILEQPLVTSPTASSPPPDHNAFERASVASSAQKSGYSRPDSKLGQALSQTTHAPSRSSSSHANPPTYTSESARQATSPEPRPSTPTSPPRFANASPKAWSSPRSASPLRAASPPQPQTQPPISSPQPPPPSIRMVPDRSISQASIPTTLQTISTPSTVPASPNPRSLHSPLSSNPPSSARQKEASLTDDILGDAGAALFYMQHMNQQDSGAVPLRKSRPPPISDGDEDEDEEEDEETDSESEPYTPPPRHAATTPLRMQQQSRSPPPPGNDQPPAVPAKSPPPTPAADLASTRGVETTAAPGRGSSLRNRPSGARAAPATRLSASVQNSSLQELSQSQFTGTTTASDSADDSQKMAATVAPAHASAGYDDSNADALAALSFLEQEERPAPPPVPQSPPQGKAKASGATSPPIPEVVETPASPSQTRPGAAELPRSSFAPTRLAAQRKAKSQAQQAAQQAAAHRPGKANGRNRGGKAKGADVWGDSSEEEEEEEEEDDDDEDVDSDTEPPPRAAASVSDHASVTGTSARSPYGQPGIPSPARSAHDVNNVPSPRRPRDLPQVPGGQGPEDYLGAQPVPRRYVSDTFIEPGRRSLYPAEGGGGSRGPSPQFGQSSMMRQSQYPPQLQPQQQQGPSRPIWSQVLDPDRNVDPTHQRDTFIQMEPPSTTMTKAFTPHGLLSAGLQDKQDRSAKKQEELARETGASLINVPLKPPPPQTGLLGAVTAHERERKREGGLGAALTEREREKRLAEERQRKLDEFQKQQLDQMQQGGSMYGGMMGFNPMMGNPMMMGMNPMMTGGWGNPYMMPSFAPNPQQLFAAQQAAQQAYQQAMYAFSAAGSQIGGNDNGPAQQPMNPMLTGNSMAMGGMGGFDPRMSMMSMPMMGMNPMGMTPTGMSGMGGMGAMGGLGFDPRMSMMGGGMGMQMTGGSQFDARLSPGVEPHPKQQGDVAGRPFSSPGNSSAPAAAPQASHPGSNLRPGSSDGSAQNASGPPSNAQ
ncbi:hypothetical protein DICSQDRAFT_159886 [Dichomitus squalens LYAD-421 SS1]|uniref:uncharacterized protein n=1 Tax=Dichomitus squalens (strain LYAD-421) TaxID=732165 RepID=UPI00044120F0|nr:uncharacterized protein DICSQDRAFT_159886 [Dichomitus squalens LYAD-421 SS1]EJF64913.1 hypothetical protein DICSQDRAFT_159886 [Dichomitus squalens LYAD-421 SS1]